MTETTKPPKYCLVDLDGVLADFVEAACYEHCVENPYKASDEHLGTFDIAKATGIDNDEFWEPMNDHEFWLNLKLMPDAVHILMTIDKFFEPENVAICTAPSRSPESASGKMEWVQKMLPQYRRRLIITPAKHFLAHRGVLLIDDRDCNVKKFVADDGYGILYPRKWNSQHHIEFMATEHLLTQLEILFNVRPQTRVRN